MKLHDASYKQGIMDAEQAATAMIHVWAKSAKVPDNIRDQLIDFVRGTINARLMRTIGSERDELVSVKSTPAS